jgi:hypothetical protein
LSYGNQQVVKKVFSLQALMKPQLRKYSLLMKYTRFLSRILALVFFLKGLFYFLIGISSLLNTIKYGFMPFINGLIYFGINGVFVPVFFMLMGDLNSCVSVDDLGLHSRLFGKTLDVNWSDILDVKPIKLLGLLKFPNKYIIVTKGRLSLLHIFYGIFYGSTKQPSLPIDPSISDCPNLIEKISKQAKKNHRAEAKSESTAH